MWRKLMSIQYRSPPSYRSTPALAELVKGPTVPYPALFVPDDSSSNGDSDDDPFGGDGWTVYREIFWRRRIDDV